MDPLELFDHLVIFRKEEIVTNDGPICVEAIIESIIEDLNEALTDRSTCVSKVEIPIERQFLPAIGIRLSGQSASSIITRGPQSGSEAGEAFRQFWSDKCELRRIDGDLYECVVWSTKDNVVRQIVDYVLESRFKLSRGPFTQWTWNQITPDRLDALLSWNPTVSSLTSTGASSLRLIRAMDKLRGLLRGLNEKLPLDITGILPVSSAFRDTAVFPPVVSVPSALGNRRASKRGHDALSSPSSRGPIFPLYVVITLEQSGKWPDELEAFTHMKRLLVIRIHELLSPVGIPSHVTKNNMLDIFLDGLVFRVSIAQPRELRLLQKTSIDTPDVGIQLAEGHSSMAMPVREAPSIHTPASLAWARLNQSMPAVCGMLAAVARSEAHVFPVACRLAKRWLSAHGYPVIMCPFEAEHDGLHELDYEVAVASATNDDIGLTRETHLASSMHGVHSRDCSGRLTEIAVELLVLYAAGFSTPVEQRWDVMSELGAGGGSASVRVATGSPLAAFLRFLRLLATHDWEAKPLLVDLNEGFADLQKRRAALNCFETGRDQLPAMVLCTPLDTNGSEWTSVGPTRVGLKALQTLAAQSRMLLRAMLVAGAKIREIKSVFRPSQRNLDILLSLKPEVVHVRSAEAIDYDASCMLPKEQRVTTDDSKRGVSNSEEELPSEIPPPGARFWPEGYCYDPMNWFVKLVQIHLGRYCEVRWDRHGGRWIGLRWRPAMRSNSIECAFGRDSFDGLVVHKQSTSTSESGAGPRMCVTHRLSSVLKLLPKWVSMFVDKVELIQDDQVKKRSLRKTKKSAKVAKTL